VSVQIRMTYMIVAANRPAVTNASVIRRRPCIGTSMQLNGLHK
jgi:hypothetical protein